MNVEKIVKKSFYIVLFAAFLVNIIAYIQLPEKVGLQITLSGQLANYVPKLLFVVVAPLLMILTKLLTRKSGTNESVKILLVSIVIFIFNIVTILFNLK